MPHGYAYKKIPFPFQKQFMEVTPLQDWTTSPTLLNSSSFSSMLKLLGRLFQSCSLKQRRGQFIHLLSGCSAFFFLNFHLRCYQIYHSKNSKSLWKRLKKPNFFQVQNDFFFHKRLWCPCHLYQRMKNGVYQLSSWGFFADLFLLTLVFDCHESEW